MPHIDSKRKWHIQFGVVSSTSLGEETVTLPIGSMWRDVLFHTMLDPVPLLRSLVDIGRPGAYYDNLDDYVIHKDTKAAQNVHLKFGNPFVDWHTENRRF